MSRPPSSYTSPKQTHLPSVRQHYPPDTQIFAQQPPPLSYVQDLPGPNERTSYPFPRPSSSAHNTFRPLAYPSLPSRHDYSASPFSSSTSRIQDTHVGPSWTTYPKPYPPPPAGQKAADPAKDEDAEEGASSAEDETLGEKQKLEVKREKNRLKQRNLRTRRANHVYTLESSLQTAEQKFKLLEEQHEEVQRREAGLLQYVAKLEDVLQRHGFEAELDRAKSTWDSAAYQLRPSTRGGGTTERDEITRGKRRRTEAGERDDGGSGPSRFELPSQGNILGNEHPDPPDYAARQTDRALPPFAQPDLLRRPTSGYARPRSSTTSFAPLVLDSSHSSFFVSAPSPRSMRIEDLLSPSLTQADTPAVPMSAYTIDTPDHLASTPSFNPEIRPSGSRQSSMSQSMFKQGSADSLEQTILSSKSLAVGAVGDTPATISPYPFLTRSLTLALPEPPRISSLTTPPLHPSVHTARVLLRVLLADQGQMPISHCTLPPLTPSQQTILLNAIYNLTTPAFRDKVNEEQITTMPPVLTKLLLGYSHSSTADLRIVLMPIAILRARVVGFLKDQLPFDVTAFISHVLADGRIFGDTADPAAWEMSDMFWDVWGGWFKAGRKFCSSMRGWRRRHGHKGANVIEILLGLEAEDSRMTELIGQPPGWKRPVIVPPDKEMVEETAFTRGVV